MPLNRLARAVVGVAILCLPACDQRTQSLSDYKREQEKAADQEEKLREELQKLGKDGLDLPLPETGPYSYEKLRKELAKIDDDLIKLHFERAYRLTFTPDRVQKNPAAAMKTLEKLVQLSPTFAPAFRVAGYVEFQLGRFPDACTLYARAIELDPNYGEAHYALASILASFGQDPELARKHLDRALELGVEDSMDVKTMLARQRTRMRDAEDEMPAGHPPMPGAPPGAPAADVPTDGEAIPLKLSGIGSVEELQRGLAKLQDPALKKSLENGFRYTFSPKTQFRDRAAAKSHFERVIAGDANCAAAYRGLAYVLFDTGDSAGSVSNYEKALQLDPDYGEAHYALSFIMTMAQDQHEEGLKHFKRAMELNVPDERKLGERFYPEAK